MKNQPLVAIFLVFIVAVTMDLAQILGESPNMGVIQQHCLNITGSNETFNWILENFQTGAECVASRFNFSGMTNEKWEWLSSHQNDSLAYFQGHCAKADDIRDCYTPFTTELQKCIDMKQLMSDVNQLPQTAEYLCRTSSLEIIKISAAVATCKDRMNIQGLNDLEPQECSEWEQFRQCVHEGITDRSPLRSVRLFDMYYWSVVMNSPCGGMSTNADGVRMRIKLYDNVILAEFFESIYGRV